MKTQEEIRAACASALRDLRISNGYSKAAMCDAAGVDIKTWNKYESGESAPDVARFVAIYANLGESAIKAALNIVYPETYSTITPQSDITELRQAAAHYFLNIASDQAVHEWEYLVFGEHGSNIEPQLQEFTMIDHLPMSYRYAIAEMVLTFWNLATARHELVGMDNVMPNVDIFLRGLRQGQDAANTNRNSYTTGARSDSYAHAKARTDEIR